MALTIDWEAIAMACGRRRLSRPTRVHADFHRKSLRGTRPWAISGDPYDPDAAAERAREQGREFLGVARRRLADHRDEAGAPGLCVFAIDTELLGHWWWEGPAWLEEVLDGADEAGIELVTAQPARSSAIRPPSGRSPPPPGARART